MELVIIFLIIFVIYGAGWIWQTVTDVVRDINRQNYDNRIYGQVASTRSVKRKLGGRDLASLRKVYGELAEHLDAHLHDRQLFESPKVSFVYKNSRALLSIYETRQSPPRFYTQITFTIPSGWPHRLEIFPQRFDEADTRYLNVGDIKIGDDQFDPRYIIKSNDDNFAKMYLDPPSRDKIEQLRSLMDNDKILVSVNSSRVLIRKHSILSTQDDLRTFADLCCGLYDRVFALWQEESGIELMEEEDQEQGPAVCQVCGAGLDPADTVYCKRCKTPHHDQCWKFNQGCSTFACGESKFTKKY